MFKLPDFPSVDFSKFDVDALRNIDLSKYVPAVNFPKVSGWRRYVGRMIGRRAA